MNACIKKLTVVDVKWKDGLAPRCWDTGPPPSPAAVGSQGLTIFFVACLEK